MFNIVRKQEGPRVAPLGSSPPQAEKPSAAREVAAVAPQQMTSVLAAALVAWLVYSIVELKREIRSLVRMNEFRLMRN